MQLRPMLLKCARFTGRYLLFLCYMHVVTDRIYSKTVYFHQLLCTRVQITTHGVEAGCQGSVSIQNVSPTLDKWKQYR